MSYLRKIQTKESKQLSGQCDSFDSSEFAANGENGRSGRGHCCLCPFNRCCVTKETKTTKEQAYMDARVDP